MTKKSGKHQRTAKGTKNLLSFTGFVRQLNPLIIMHNTESLITIFIQLKRKQNILVMQISLNNNLLR